MILPIKLINSAFQQDIIFSNLKKKALKCHLLLDKRQWVSGRLTLLSLR